MSVVPHQPGPLATADQPRWVTLLGEAAQLARMIANTNFVPKAMRGDEAAVAATILYGDEIGFPPMQALAKIAVIDGKPSLSAEGQRSLIQAAGHSLHGEGTTTKYTWTGRRGDTGDQMEFTWTIDDAKRAGIAGKQNWRTYPRAMLSARASAELARALFADVIGGLAATEELDDTTDAPPQPAPPPETPPATSSRRRRAPRTTTPVIAPQVATAPQNTPEGPPLPDETASQPAAPKASEAQLRKLFALYREHGLEDRDDRLDWSNQHLQRTIVSASELTDVEASTLIDALENQLAPPAPPVETGPAEQADLVSGTRPPARPEAASTHGASGPAEPPSEEGISNEWVDILSWMRKEAGVNDDWLRVKLTEMGAKNVPEGPITRAQMRQLTKEQAANLQSELNLAIDAKRMGTG